jgi:hypothetical protein
VIINGGSRSNWRFFAKHLMRGDQNERVEVTEIRGLAADNVLDAFREMDALASGTRAKNFFYHANINTRADELLTPEQWEQAVDTLEANLGLEGHSRFIVEHEKEGRTHCHVIWSRIDVDTMTAVSDSKNFAAHERTARTLEDRFDHEAVKGAHTRETDEKRPPRRPDNWEKFRGAKSGIDPDQVKAELTALWQSADSGQAFVTALEASGYLLAKGDRRDFMVIDQAGDAHSLARRIEGAKAKDIRARLDGIDRDALPTVAEASALMKTRQDDSEPGGDARERPQDEREQKDAARSPTPVESFASAVTGVMAANDGELRHTGGFSDFIGKLAETARDLLADESGSSKPATLSGAIGKFAAEVEHTMLEHDGDLPHGDGLSWWERVLVTAGIHGVADYVEQTLTKLSGAAGRVADYWRNLVDASSEDRHNQKLQTWADKTARKDTPEAPQRDRDDDKGFDR